MTFRFKKVIMCKYLWTELRGQQSLNAPLAIFLAMILASVSLSSTGEYNRAKALIKFRLSSLGKSVG